MQRYSISQSPSSCWAAGLVTVGLVLSLGTRTAQAQAKAPGTEASAAQAQETPPPGFRLVGRDKDGPIYEMTPEEAEARKAVSAFQNLHAEQEQKAQRNSQYALVKDADPEGTAPVGLEKKNPMAFAYYLMELSGKIERAEQEGDSAMLLKYLRAFAKVSPNEALPFRKLCAAYEQVQQWSSAEDACHNALSGNGVTLDDAKKYVQVALAASEVTPVVRERIKGVLEHLRSQPGAQLATSELECQYATRVEDGALLERCVKSLEQLAPNGATTLTFAWALAMSKRDLSGARRVMDRAISARLPEAVIAEMRHGIEAESKLPNGAWFAAAGVGLLGIGGLIWLARRRSFDRPAAQTSAS